VRRRKSRLIHEAARQLNTALGPRVRLKVYALADRMGFQEALEDAVRGQNVRSEQIARSAAVRSRAWFDARCGRPDRIVVPNRVCPRRRSTGVSNDTWRRSSIAASTGLTNNRSIPTPMHEPANRGDDQWFVCLSCSQCFSSCRPISICSS
jgi:hypothetical protein